MSYRTTPKRWLTYVLVFIVAFTIQSRVASAQTVTPYSDLSSWMSAIVFGSDELFETTASNIGLADELTAAPAVNEKVGPLLTFQAANIISTGVTRGFQVESLQFVEGSAASGFTFDDQDGSTNWPDFDDALSVGDGDDFEDDDWSLSLLDSSTMSAFAVMLQNNNAQAGEKMDLYSGMTLLYSLDLSSIGSPGNSNDFVGFTADFLFDRVVFNEDAGGDDIAIADFRFASSPAVVPEPVSSTLFILGGATLGIRRFWKKRSA